MKGAVASRSRMLTVLAVAVLSGLLVCGCGAGGGETPADTANKVIDAYRAGDAAEGRSYFMNPGLYDEFVEMIPDGAAVRVANESQQDESNATVDVLFGSGEGADGYTLILGNPGGGWKVVSWETH